MRFARARARFAPPDESSSAFVRATTDTARGPVAWNAIAAARLLLSTDAGARWAPIARRRTPGPSSPAGATGARIYTPARRALRERRSDSCGCRRSCDSEQVGRNHNSRGIHRCFVREQERRRCLLATDCHYAARSRREADPETHLARTSGFWLNLERRRAYGSSARRTAVVPGRGLRSLRRRHEATY